MVLDCLEVKSQTVNSRCTLNPAIEAKMSLDFIGGFKCSSYIPIPIFWTDKAQPENCKVPAVDTTHAHLSACSGGNRFAKSRILNIRQPRNCFCSL